MDSTDQHKNVKRCIEKWMDSRQSSKGRSASFDYCFNYFQDFRERGCIEAICESENMQESCLQLAFYLASWGMLRASSQLLQKSAKFYERLIVKIANSDKKTWGVDIDSYSDDAIDLILCVMRGFGEILDTGVTATDTLVTKIMLGVYGNIPAFDRYFRIGLGVGTVNKKNLKRIAQFYQDHKSEIDAYGPIYTLDFRTGMPTKRQYTKAKIVDMIGHVSGW